MNKPIDLVGKRFDKLIVLSRMEMTPSGSIWLCQCECGQVIRKMTTQLRRKNRLRGGCRNCETKTRSESSSLNKNGNCKGGKTRLYVCWKGMMTRCYNLNFHQRKDYGGKGIAVSESWKQFPAFKQWAMTHGYTDNLTLDRLDPNKNYEPSNCEWVTKSENSRRRHVALELPSA